jgi:hypothetical protein
MVMWARTPWSTVLKSVPNRAAICSRPSACSPRGLMNTASGANIAEIAFASCAVNAASNSRTRCSSASGARARSSAATGTATATATATAAAAIAIAIASTAAVRCFVIATSPSVAARREGAPLPDRIAARVRGACALVGARRGGQAVAGRSAPRPLARSTREPPSAS